MNITHYYEYNETTKLWDLLTNDDVLVASFKDFADLKLFAKASDNIGTITGVS